MTTTPTTPPATTCPASTLAKLLGLTERRIQQLALEGHVIKGGRGEYELVGSIRHYIAYCETKVENKEESSLASARKKLIEIQIEKTALEVAILRKDWIAQSEVEQFVAELTQRFVHGLSALPGRLAVELVNQADAAVIRQKIWSECHALQNELARTIPLGEEDFDEQVTEQRAETDGEAVITALADTDGE